jgi:probable rRNA maturation factor
MAATRVAQRTGAKPPPRRGASKSAGLAKLTPVSRRSGRAPALELAVQRAVADADLPVRATLARWARAALACDAVVTLRFVGTAEGRALNRTYRSRDYATNVLAFVYDAGAPLAGDVVVCVPVARREARAQRKTLRAHLAHLVVHGMLHLQGHDHEHDAEAAAMEARERAILRGLRYPDPYAHA